MKLNLGCGNKKIEGWVNVDKERLCNPNKLVDLEKFPWPWEDNSVDEVSLIHVLEHLGQTTDTYLKIIKELYRICKPKAIIHIRVPHPRHDHFLDDPTHVRPITIEGLEMFDKEKNQEWKEKGFANTPLALNLGVDFKIKRWEYLIDPHFQEMVDKKQIKLEELRKKVLTDNNIVREIVIDLEVFK